MTWRVARLLALVPSLMASTHVTSQERPLMSAVDQNDIGAVRSLIADGADVNVQIAGSIEVTPLMIAARHGYAEIMNVLIANGADVNAASDLGYTALMRAARNGQTPAVRILVENGANINAQNDGGMSPLMHAANHDHIDVVRLLLANGANRDEIGELPDEPANPVQRLAQTYRGRRISQSIEKYSFVGLLLFGVLSPFRLLLKRRRIFWDKAIPVCAILLYVVYELAVPPGMIRVDLVIIYPLLLGVLLTALVLERRTRRDLERAARERDGAMKRSP